jgi:IS605 OrfB family transposase
MLCVGFKIKEISNKELLDMYISDYTEIFYKIYKHPDSIDSSNSIGYILSNYNLDKSMLDCCIKDVQTKLKQQDVININKQKRIKEIEGLLSKGIFKTKNEKRNKYRLIRKHAEIKRGLFKDCTYGGKSLLREITKLQQTSNKTQEQDSLLIKKKEQFKSKRKLPIYIEGRACEKGNRKVDFDLNNHKITLKFSKQNKVVLNLSINPNEKKKLELIKKLQHLSDIKSIPLTIRVSDEKLYITYDESIVSGYNFDMLNCKKEQSRHIDSDIKKSIYKKYCEELDKRKSINKISNRYISFDLNPHYIGVSVFDNINDEPKLIHIESISLTKLNLIKGLNSSDPKQIKRRNKRKYEIKEVWKYIFNLAKHYRVLNVVIEDLNFKHSEIKKGKGFNKQTKNLWHKTLTIELINKYCNIYGFKKIEVNPCYSSFIGNMIHPYFDPISSSIEIGRRGIVKYKKGSSIYPSIMRINQEKLNYLLGENINVDDINWHSLYKRTHLMRYRNTLQECNGLIAKNLITKQSRLIVYKSLCF